MTPPLSWELRWLVVYWYCDLNWDAEQCAAVSKRSVSTIYRVIRCFRSHGTIDNPRRPSGRSRILSTEDKGFLLSLIQAKPTLYLDEIQSLLFERLGLDVSLATISRALVAAAVSRKAIAREALERNEALRAAWQAQWGCYDASAFIWVDESGVDDRTTQRLDGYAPIGHHCVHRTLFQHGVKYSVLPALSTDGIIATSIFEGAVTKERFLSFVRTQVVS
jgi:transposase